MKVIDHFKVKQVAGDIGIEIEVEGRNLPAATASWLKTDDGSLKPQFEAAEYVLRKPCAVKAVEKVLKELKDAYKETGTTVDHTYRAGIHAHINVQELTMAEMVNMVLLFIIMEDGFLQFCEDSRIGNHFCLRTSDASYFTHMLWKACEMNDTRYLKTDDLRYSAINLQSLHKYGSIEFRCLESTDDFDKVEKWCKMLYKLREGAVKYPNPREMLMSFSRGGFEKVVDEVMGEYAPIIKTSKNWRKEVREGLWRAQDIAFSRDWSNVNLNIFMKQNEVF